MRRLLVPALVVLFAAGLVAGCGAGGGLTGTGGASITRTLPAQTRTGPAVPATTESETTTAPVTSESAPPPATTVIATTNTATVILTQTQTHTHTETHTTTAASPTTTVSATTTVVNTGAAVVAGAAVAASQTEEQESTPWGWIAFGILAAAVVIFAIVWLVRRKHENAPPSAPA